MKRNNLFFAVVAVAVAFTSCDKLVEYIFKRFEAPIDFNITIDPVIAGVQGSLGSSVVNYDLEAKVRENTENKLGADKITQMYVKDISINLSNGNANNNLGNFSTLSIELSDAAGTVTIGPFQIPETAGNSISLPIANSPNIRRFFNGDDVSFNVLGMARTDTNIPLQAQVRAILKFDQ